MFYENERIIRKQAKVINLKAYEIIQDLETKGLNNQEIISCINLLLKEDSTEFQKDILEHALKTLNLRKESKNVSQIDTSYSFIDGRIQPKSGNTRTNKVSK